ncbi:GNAT family N-acetyltransferase [Sphingomonas sp.]|uniref:GNAT family N-acetyltransferase n=1 Tax=Sphingomonas sp. TaxID=28214 RepID=UPI0025DDEE5E|nr:GNAT family N-acetyltransferase [Sphingomonas sp.]MBV9527665.1 GNAT family N-acetyltransferase [Sphingomonas sp.]
MATPAIREAIALERGTADDLDSVMIVMEQAFGSHFGEAWTRSQCAGILPMTGVLLRLARTRDSGLAVGFSLSRSIVDDAELLLIAVAPAQQRRGVGRLLLEDFIEQARTSGISTAHLEVRDGNGAMSMYRDAGFAPVGRRRKYYHAPDGSAFDALTFMRKI